jgi:hypothetical protein
MKSSKAKAETSDSVAAAGDEGEGAEVGTVLKSHGLVTIQVAEVLYGTVTSYFFQATVLLIAKPCV